MRVIVTRPRDQAGPLVERLELRGHEVVECPLIEIVRTSDEQIDAAGYDWVIVTSPNGADEIARRGRNLPKLAAVGPGTAERLARARAASRPSSRACRRRTVCSPSSREPAGRVLFAAAENSRRGPIEELDADFVPLYATRLLAPDPPDGDVVVLASGSAARAYAAVGGRAPVVSIGPQTSHVAASVGLSVVAEAASHDLDGLVARRRRSSVRAVKHRFITFLTDFGLTDDFVGTCHGVIKRIAPDVEIIDMTHGITPQGVLPGALVLRNTLPYLPEGVHLAVVDPGVGSARRPVIIRDANGDCSSAPTTDCSSPRPSSHGIESAHELANPAYALEPVSRTFHGRDLFAPAAAHLALGVEPSELGPPLSPDALVRLDLPEPEVERARDRSARALRRSLREHAAQPDA